MCGLLQDGVCLPAGQILPANNRVTSWKPLTAADELVPGGAGGRGEAHSGYKSGNETRLRGVIIPVLCVLVCSISLPCVDE